MLKEHICSLEGTISIKERELKRVIDLNEDDRDKCLRDLKAALEELQIAQTHAKSAEVERQEIKKRYQTLEDAYKRDSELFRAEAMKRD